MRSALVPAPAAKRQTEAPQRPARVLRSTSNLVHIDVEVTDHAGRPIKGLQPEQFVVTDDGKPQKLAFFAHFDAHVPVEWAVIGLMFCSAVGVGFGMRPAVRASRLHPIEALRHE